MSRIRTIKPSFWISEQILECRPVTRLLFIGMWNFCDDNGVHPASYKTIKAEVFPGDDLTTADVQTMIDELLKQKLIDEFEVEEKKWWVVTGWYHQLISRPTPSRYPVPPTKQQGKDSHGALTEDSVNAHGALTEDSVNAHGTLTEDSVNAHGALTEDSVNAHGTLTAGKDSSGKEGKGNGKEGSITEPAAPHTTASAAPPASAPKNGKERPPSRKTQLPSGFKISPRVQTWADQHGYSMLDLHLEAFTLKAQARGYQYNDWDAAFMGAIRDDWARLRQGAQPQQRQATTNDPAINRWGQILSDLKTGRRTTVIEGETLHETH